MLHLCGMAHSMLVLCRFVAELGIIAACAGSNTHGAWPRHCCAGPAGLLLAVPPAMPESCCTWFAPTIVMFNSGQTSASMALCSTSSWRRVTCHGVAVRKLEGYTCAASDQDCYVDGVVLGMVRCLRPPIPAVPYQRF